MPALGMAQETGKLIQWLKAPGDSVSKGEPLMEVETDKATVEIEAPATGVLANVIAHAGDEIPVGQPIAVILAPGESAPAVPAPARPVTVVNTATPAAPVISAVAASPSKAGNGRLLASPKARRLAGEQGIDLYGVAGSGPGGAVLASDVLAAAGAIQAAPVSTLAPLGETMPVSRLWQVMAERVTQAWTTIPHFYLNREVGAAGLQGWLAEARQRSAEKITITDLLVRLTSAALRQHPRLNAWWLNGGIVLNTQVSVGIAVAVEDGLVVPVIHNSDGLGLGQLAARRIALVAKAQAGKLSPDDISGGTFTISNLGMYGVDAFNAIVNPPQAAILAVSRIAERVVPVDGRPAVVSTINLSLSCDHRVVDGARGAQFLQTLSELIENPLRMWD